MCSQFHTWHRHPLGQSETDDWFLDESEAYARLMHGGACQSQYVIQCFGRYRFPSDWRARHSNTVDPHTGVDPFVIYENDLTPPVALILECLEHAQPLTPLNITDQIVDDVLRGLHHIHLCGVLHSDPYPRNILLDKMGQPVWVCFSQTFLLNLTPSNPSSISIPQNVAARAETYMTHSKRSSWIPGSHFALR